MNRMKGLKSRPVCFLATRGGSRRQLNRQRDTITLWMRPGVRICLPVLLQRPWETSSTAPRQQCATFKSSGNGQTCARADRGFLHDYRPREEGFCWVTCNLPATHWTSRVAGLCSGLVVQQSRSSRKRHPLQEQRHRQTQPVPAVQTAPVGPANGKSRWQHKGGSTGIALGLSCCKLLVCCASWDVALHRGWGRWSGGVVGAHCGAFILGVGCGGPGIRIGRRQLPQHVHRALKAVPPLFWVPVQIQGPDRFRRVLQLFSHHTTHQLLQHTYTRQAKPPPPAPP